MKIYSISFAKDTRINQVESIIKEKDETIARLNGALQLKDAQINENNILS